MNKHIETLLTSLAENARNQAEMQQDLCTFNNQDTQKLVRALVNGEGLRPTRTAASNDGTSASGSGSSQSNARQPGTTTSPQRR
ncbi:unnamed protein product [Thelazia callipaeda]|uniref:Uncharacterized protein n=1 Tax=Thelazia callipaeda TaxID=103827 RepID=A0A0N5D9X9_THECL|nr:unnamed protein product [Thelazia callipaeda]